MMKTREQVNEYYRAYYHAHRDVMNNRNKARYHRKKLEKKRNQENSVEIKPQVDGLPSEKVTNADCI